MATDIVAQVSSAAAARPRAVTTGATTLSRILPERVGAILQGRACLDWLRLTTFNYAAYNEVAEKIRSLMPETCEWSVQQRMQYRGLATSGVFLGAGQQVRDGGNQGVAAPPCSVRAARRDELQAAGVDPALHPRLRVDAAAPPAEDHYLIDLSGGLAHLVLSLLLADPDTRHVLSEFKCTRIDVQYTHDEVLDIDLAAQGRALREAEWAVRFKQPKITIIDGDKDRGNPWTQDGNSTLYIGSRQSQRYQRVYEKQINGTPFIRWETEYKGQLAGNLWALLLSDGQYVNQQTGELTGLTGLAVLPAILLAEMSIVPDAGAFDALRAVLGEPAVERLKMTRDASDALSRVSWLARCVAPCVGKLVNELARADNEGNYVRLIFNEWLEIVSQHVQNARELLAEHLDE